MSNNDSILKAIRDSFKDYLIVNTSRSTAKLKKLHGCIANDLHNIFGTDYDIMSQGYGQDREKSIEGRYYPKNVDITVTRHGHPVAGYAVKFVVRNYSQNSNNYFENMLGETANIRSNMVPYFQIFIVFDKVPYYKVGGIFDRYDIITEHNLRKYLLLSRDDPSLYFHTPDKTLILLIHLKEKEKNYHFINSEDYANYYMSVIDNDDLITFNNNIKDVFEDSVIFNDYYDFLIRSFYITVGKSKNKVGNFNVNLRNNTRVAEKNISFWTKLLI